MGDYTDFLSAEMIEWMERTERKIAGKLQEIERVADYNQWKVLRAFQKHRVSDFHFSPSTGYGYNDLGRETLDQIYADVFGAEAAIVRPHFASGTHTICAALFGVLRPGDRLLYITGRPYETLHKVIGQDGDGTGSLRDFGIGYDMAELTADGAVDWQEVERLLDPKSTKVIGIQRSCGYDWRASFTNQQIGEMVERVKQIHPQAIIFVDNCYGEFAERDEPTDWGADLIAGSLIKNPGGGIALSGGYIAGRERLVELASYRLTAPGIGGDVGATFDTKRAMFQGLFLAPHIVAQALKGSVFAAAMFEDIGLLTRPSWDEHRTDIIQAAQFADAEALIAFVQAVQAAAPVDSHVVPIPSDMPGYEHQVIMAAGTFIQGGSIELSADAPIRAPYTAYLQGGLTYAHTKYAVLRAIETMREKGVL